MRHLQIHQDQVPGRRGFRQLHRLSSVLGQTDLGDAQLMQQVDGHFLVQGLIFDQQEPHLLEQRVVAFGQRGLGRAGATQQRRHPVVQGTGRHGLDQHLQNARLACGVVDLRAVEARDDDHRRLGFDVQLAQLAGHLHPRNAGHLPIDQQQIEGLVLAGRQHRQHQGFLAVACVGDLEVHVPQQALQDFAGARVVVDHQDPAPAPRGQGAAWGQALTHPHLGGEPERGPLARCAGDTHFAAHQLGQALGNGQPQARAAIPPGGGGVGLLEGLEQSGHLLFVQTDAGVAHGEAQGHRRAGMGQLADAHHHLARRRELDGVVDVVHQHLTQAQFITHPVGRQVRGDVEDQLQALAGGLVGQQGAQRGQETVEGELRALHAQHAGLDLGDVQHVVDDTQQVMTGLLHVPQMILLPRVLGRLQGQMRHAHDGVQRGADLVAHVGQEVRLHTGQILGCIARLRQTPVEGGHLFGGQPLRTFHEVALAVDVLVGATDPLQQPRPSLLRGGQGVCLQAQPSQLAHQQGVQVGGRLAA